MEILITGSAGFIGSHLVEEIEKTCGYKVYLYDRNFGDLKTEKSFPIVDVVIHLAAYNSTKDFYNDSFNIIKENIQPTLNILEYYRNQDAFPLFVYAGTPESIAGATDYFNYKIPTDEDCPIVITDVKNTRWSYAGSKSLGEQAVIASGLPWIIVRPNNIYGPRQKNHFVDEFIARAKTGDVSLYGYENTRSWLYVKDCCEAIVKLIHEPKAVGEIVNIGTDKECTVLDVANIILEYMNITDPITLYPAPLGSVTRRAPDISKIRRLVGWEPKVSLREGMKLTVESYK
jgi:UDP-glucose 4-epimerase